MSRCMGDGVMNTEYPEGDQRTAVCSAAWGKREHALADPARVAHAAAAATWRTHNNAIASTALPAPLMASVYDNAGLQKLAQDITDAGVVLVVGTLKPPAGTEWLPGAPNQAVHAVRFAKDAWDIARAKMWLEHHKYWCCWAWAEDDASYMFTVMERTMFESVREIEVAGGMAENEDTGSYAQADLREIKGVEIFRTGKWNGDDYDEADLQDMVEAFPKAGFNVPVKLGHEEVSGAPAYGWVKNLRRVGKKLLCDFMDIPAKLAAAITEHAYDHVSAEIFWNLKRGKDTFRRVLKAVALLGAETPGVAGLKPLREVSFSQFSYQRLAICAGKETVTMTQRNADPRERVKEIRADIDAAAGDATKVKALTVELDTTLAVLTAVPANADKNAFEIVRLTETIEELKKTNAQRAEGDRQRLVDEKTSKCPIPALREHVRAAYDLATRASAAGEKATFRTYKKVEGAPDVVGNEQVDPVQVIDDMVTVLTRNAEKLFREYGSAGEMRTDGAAAGPGYGGGASGYGGAISPSQEADQRARQYVAQHPTVKYADALKIVLNADPALKAAYAA